MADRTYRWLLLSLAVLGFAADQASKYAMFRWLHHDGQPADRGAFQAWTTVPDWRNPDTKVGLHGGRYNLIPGWFGFTAEFDASTPPCDCRLAGLQTWSAPVLPRVNHGALFGMGQSRRGTANGFFAVVSVVAAAAILTWGLRRSTAREKWLMAALGLILAGTVGNLYDRLVFNGVRDFLYFYYIEWPVFNFADCCLVVGAALLLLQAIFATPPSDEKPVSSTDEPVIPEGPKV